VPALPPVPNVLRCFIEGFVDNDDTYRWGNVLYFEFTGGSPTPSNLTALCNDVGTAWNSNVAELCPSPIHLTNVKLTDLTSSTSSEATASTPHAGTRGDDSIPANAAVLMSYPSGGLRYRGGHPRSYLLAGGNADLEGAAHWAETFRALAEGKWNDFIATISALSEASISMGQHVAVSYRSGNARRTSPVVLTLGPAAAAAEMASQRRRIGRRKHRR